MIFAREVSDPLTSLVKKLDEITDKKQDCQMGSFVVFCNDADGLDKKLEELARKQKFKHIILSIDNPAGPTGYNIAKEADITVVLYLEHKVLANFAYRKGEMKDKDIDKILAEVPKILPKG